MTNQKTVLVAGATGRQGGAVVNELLAHGHKVIAYIQDAKDPRAQALAQKGTQLAEGTLEDIDALKVAAQPVDAIFSITVPFGPQGQTGEVMQGKSLANVAASLGKHLVYSSIAGAKPSADLTVEHAGSKQQIEAYFKTKPDLKATIVAPVYIMENILNTKANGLARGVYAQALSPDHKINQVTVLDIASLAVWAIEHPETMVGQRIEVASEDISGNEIAKVLSDLLGRTIPYVQLSLDHVRQTAGNEIAAMYEKFENNPYKIDIPALHKRFPDIKWHTFKEWAETVEWSKLVS
jgi:uncharacterized protein YbjT (DUF2867 family)